MVGTSGFHARAVYQSMKQPAGPHFRVIAGSGRLCRFVSSHFASLSPGLSQAAGEPSGESTVVWTTAFQHVLASLLNEIWLYPKISKFIFLHPGNVRLSSF